MIQPLSFVVAAHDAESAEVLERMLAAQVWQDVRVVHPVAQAVRVARESDAHAVFMLPDVTLLPNALESAWWALDTQATIGFVAFADARGPRTPMLESVGACVVVRAALLADGASASDARWPGFAPVFTLLEQGHRGHLVREPLMLRTGVEAAATATDVTFAGAVAELRSKGLTDQVLGDMGHDPMPQPEPLQLIDERPVPPATARRRDFANNAIEGKRVLALLQGFPMGGYTAFNADFLPRLVSRGHAVTVCTTEVWRTDWRLETVRASTADVVHAPGVVPLASMPRYISYLIESRNIDVVFVSHAMAAYRMLPWLRQRHAQTAFMDYVHTDWFEAQMYGSYATLGAAHAEWLDVQVATSGVLAAELVARGSRGADTRAVPINLDVTDWDPARFKGEEVRKALGCKPAQPLILFAGRVSPEKRPLLAVECWKALVESGIDARFAVMGSGQQLGDMVEAVNTAGLKGRVEFVGELDGDMLRYVYSAADVFHAPSAIEGIARSLFEAMAMQCVPVVADVGGQRELVHEECGFLVPHGDREMDRYVEALRLAVAQPARGRMQKASRARIVRHFNSALTVSGMEQAFEAALVRRRAAPGVMTDSMSAARELAVSGLETARRHFWRAQGR